MPPSKSNFNHLKILFALCCIMGQLNPVDLNVLKFKPSKLLRFYSILIIVGTISGYVYTTYEGGSFFPQTTVVVMTYMEKAIFTISSVYCMICNVFLKRKKLELVLKKLSEVDKGCQPTRRNYRLIFGNFLFVGITTGDILWFEFGGKEYFNHDFLQYVRYYQAFLTFLLISSLLTEIKIRLEQVNALLIEDLSIKKVLTLTRNYELLTETINLFNDIFGWQLLIMFIYSLIGLLAALNTLIVFTRKGYEVFDTPWFFVVILDYTIFFIVNWVIISKDCQQVQMKAKETASICFKRLHNLESFSAVRESLIHLNRECTLRNPELTAAEFFSVNYTSVFLLFTTLSSYAVVLIQFNT